MMHAEGKKTKRTLSRARFQIIPDTGQPSRRRDWIGPAKFRHLIGEQDVKNTVPFPSALYLSRGYLYIHTTYIVSAEFCHVRPHAHVK